MPTIASPSRRSFLKSAAGLAVGGSLFLDGCAPAFNQGAKKTLNFWAFSDTRIIWQKKAWQLYKQQKKPDFEINWLIFPYTQMHDQVLITSQAGSGGPDIADIEISQFSRYIKGDIIFADLSAKLQQLNVMDKLYRPSATDPWTWKGKIYGIGNELNTCLMSYRWDIWKKAGLKAPVATWDDFAEQGKKFHADTKNYLLDFPFSDWGYWWIMSLQQKGGFFNDQGVPTLNSPANVKSLQYQKDAIKDGWGTVRPNGQAYNTALGQGSIATLLGPSWNFSGFTQENLPETKGKWQLQPIPTWETGGSRTATWGGTGVSVLKTSSSVDEAIDFVLFEHTSTEALLYDFAARQVWPTYRPALDDPTLTKPLPFFNDQKVGDLIKEVSPEINKWYNSPFWPETTGACVNYGLTPAIQKADVSAQQALDEAQNQCQSVISFESA
ncbi:putative arabinose-binding protein [Dictyobacter alpinus]|uniref:Putative arabinose-binding protein n=1 Tax=Dictyobacter alpinus TaxID=2014873 RepID=A0A402B2L7_9CHLR|nr:extracellular solute-binding protein [Dictyobacter alpinus]GCE25596.1 putative arabinose-binding protein [Dictyobacter alpinus]